MDYRGCEGLDKVEVEALFDCPGTKVGSLRKFGEIPESLEAGKIGLTGGMAG